MGQPMLFPFVKFRAAFIDRVRRAPFQAARRVWFVPPRSVETYLLRDVVTTERFNSPTGIQQRLAGFSAYSERRDDIFKDAWPNLAA
jgi:hypothetical protein